MLVSRQVCKCVLMTVRVLVNVECVCGLSTNTILQSPAGGGGGGSSYGSGAECQGGQAAIHTTEDQCSQYESSRKVSEVVYEMEWYAYTYIISQCFDLCVYIAECFGCL